MHLAFSCMFMTVVTYNPKKLEKVRVKTMNSMICTLLIVEKRLMKMPTLITSQYTPLKSFRASNYQHVK